MAEVGNPNFLARRKGSANLYYRRRLPREVALRSGKAEFWISLRTGSRSEALAKIREAEEAYWAEVSRLAPSGSASEADGLRGSIKPQAHHAERSFDVRLPELTLTQAKSIAWRFFDEERRKLDLLDANWSVGDDDEVGDIDEELARLKQADHPDGLRWVEAEEIRLLSANGLRSDTASEPSRFLRQLLRRAMLHVLTIRAARLSGDYSDRVPDAFFSGGLDTQRTGPVVGRSLVLEAVAQGYDTEHIEPDGLTQKTISKNRAALALIRRFFGDDTPIASINRDDCYRFRDTLGRLPPNVTKLFPSEADLSSIANENFAASGSTLNRQTQSHYLRVLSRLFAFAVDRQYVSENPAQNIRPRGRSKRKEAAKNAYSPSQLTKIFNAPLYVGCKDDERGFSEPGPNVLRRSRFWVPLIALFSGLRLEEILQLTCDHVKDGEDGLPYLFVSPDMKVKTENGYRQVPVHRELLRIGFMKLVEQARQRESKLLFDDVPRGSDSYRSTVFSKRYSTFQKSLHLSEPDRKVSFHSFRHNFRDAMRLPDASPDLVREIGGWSRGSDVSNSYGDGTPAHVLRGLVDRATYGVDLKHLYTAREREVALRR